MTADRLVEILISRGCQPETQHDCHELRDAVHETVHVLQCRSRTYEREALHEKLCRQAESEAHETGLNDTTLLVRYELQARAVEKLTCEHFKIPYDIEHWAFIMWMETAKSIHVNIGELDDVREAIITTSKLLPARMMFERVLLLRPRRRKAGSAS